jgi:hypothetical protein
MVEEIVGEYTTKSDKEEHGSKLLAILENVYALTVQQSAIMNNMQIMYDMMEKDEKLYMDLSRVCINNADVELMKDNAQLILGLLIKHKMKEATTTKKPAVIEEGVEEKEEDFEEFKEAEEEEEEDDEEEKEKILTPIVEKKVVSKKRSRIDEGYAESMRKRRKKVPWYCR